MSYSRRVRIPSQLHRSRLPLIGATCALACASVTSPAPTLPDGAIRILFIGNSLTYVNDMPGMVAEIARADGQSVGVATVAAAGTALVDHLTQTNALDRIGQGGWDAVVLQQGPTPAGLCRDTLVLATVALDARIRAVGARTATLMPWPYAGYPEAFSWVHESAQVASDAVHGLFLPAGDAWVAAWRLEPSLDLYGPDGYHPSVAGSLLTAFVVYEGVTGRDVRNVPADLRVPGVSLSASTVRVLQQAAHAALVAPLRGGAASGRATAARVTC